jgi:hypothetical protein
MHRGYAGRAGGQHAERNTRLVPAVLRVRHLPCSMPRWGCANVHVVHASAGLQGCRCLSFVRAAGAGRRVGRATHCLSLAYSLVRRRSAAIGELGIAKLRRVRGSSSLVCVNISGSELAVDAGHYWMTKRKCLARQGPPSSPLLSSPMTLPTTHPHHQHSKPKTHGQSAAMPDGAIAVVATMSSRPAHPGLPPAETRMQGLPHPGPMGDTEIPSPFLSYSAPPAMRVYQCNTFSFFHLYDSFGLRCWLILSSGRLTSPMYRRGHQPL